MTTPLLVFKAPPVLNAVNDNWFGRIRGLLLGPELCREGNVVLAILLLPLGLLLAILTTTTTALGLLGQLLKGLLLSTNLGLKGIRLGLQQMSVESVDA